MYHKLMFLCMLISEFQALCFQRAIGPSVPGVFDTYHVCEEKTAPHRRGDSTQSDGRAVTQRGPSAGPAENLCSQKARVQTVQSMSFDCSWAGRVHP
jgi:hypothetical protein